ncbi:MAG: rRNA adenine N-6-methyltransferase family protein, partial [Candidatus Hodarchaeales archaeon]
MKKTKNLLREYALTPKYNLGQNFCIEPDILELYKEQIQKIKPKTILEIGGGLGTLSNVAVDLNIPLTIIEKDEKFVFLLERRFGNKINIHQGDVLKFKDFVDFEMIIGNIPYEISSPLLFRIWQNFNRNSTIIPYIIITVQKEFGLRLIAQP